MWEEEGSDGWGELVGDAAGRTPARRIEATKPPVRAAPLPAALSIGWLTLEELDARRRAKEEVERSLVQEAMA